MRGTFSRGLAVSIGLVAALLVLNAALTYHNTRQLDEDARWVARTHEVLDALGQVISTVKDAETGQRGFLITGQSGYWNRTMLPRPRSARRSSALRN